MMVRQNLLIQKKNYWVVYDDEEDMAMQQVRKHWVKPEPEEDKSSSKEKQRTKKQYEITDIAKIQKFTFDKKLQMYY